MKKSALLLAVAAAISFAACNREDEPTPQPQPGVSEETYAGGVLGTTFNQSASAYEDPTPAVVNAGMVNAFSVMPSCHLILCHPLFLLCPIPPGIRVFSNESTLRRKQRRATPAVPFPNS